MLVLPGRLPTRCQAMWPRGPSGWGFLRMILNVPSASRSELLGFAQGVVGVVGVLAFWHVLLLDLCGLQLSGIDWFGASNHPTGSRGCIPVCLSFSVFKVVGVLGSGVFSVFVPRVTPGGVSAAGLRFLLLVFVERCIRRVTDVLVKLLVICSHSDGTWCVSSVRVGAVER